MGNDISYRVDDVARAARRTCRSYVTKFGDAASAALYIDGSGRKVVTPGANRPSVIPVDDVGLSRSPACATWIVAPAAATTC